MVTSYSSILKRNSHLIILSVIILLWRLSTVSYIFGDDAFYNNIGRHLMRGELPYTQYFFAHPPLFLLLSPFTFNLTAIRLMLALTQIALLIVFDKLLAFYEQGLIKRAFIDVLLILSTSFIYFYNNNLSFGLMTLWCLISYHYYLKNNKWGFIIFASIAILTRLFALFYLTPMLYIAFKKYHLTPLLALTPLIILILLIPNFINYVFLYHVNWTGHGKTMMPDSERLFYDYLFIISHIALIPLALLMIGDKNMALIATCLTTGVLNMTTTYFMYFGALTPWWLLAAFNKVNTKQLILAGLLFITSSIYLNNKIINDSMSINDANHMANTIASYDLPITGSMGMINLVQWLKPEVKIINSSREPAGIMDTLWHRWQHQVNYFHSLVNKTDHLFLCVPAPKGYHNECDLMKGLNYTLIKSYPEYKNLQLYYHKGGE